MIYRYLAHALSLSRIVLMVAASMVLVREQFTLAFVLVIIAIFTDWIDGPIARKSPTPSRLGLYLDPAGDTMIVYYPQIVLVLMGLEPVWIFVGYLGIGLALFIIRPFIIAYTQRKQHLLFNFIQVVYLEGGQVAVMIYVSTLVAPWLWLVVVAMYALGGVIKHKRVKYFLNHLRGIRENPLA